MNITTTSSAGVTARMQNIETINVEGTYVAAGFDASNVAGTQNLNLSTSIVGGTATVAGASSINIANINAGTNIATLNVTSAAGGTRDTVMVDAGEAKTVTVNGDANGIDKYSVSLADASSLTVNDAGTLGEYTANIGATATIATGTGTGIKTFEINTDSDSTVTVATDDVLTATAANLGNTDFTGAGNITLKATDGTLDGQAYTSTGAGTLTVENSEDLAAVVLSDVQADLLELKGDTSGTVTVNTNSKVNLDADNTAILIEQSYVTAASTALANGEGTLDVTLSHDQTLVETGAKVGTLLLEATPDEVTDTDDTQITVTTLALDTTTDQTETVVVSGAADLEITTIDTDADAVVTATTMTGKLTIGANNSAAGNTIITSDITVIGGTAGDDIAVNADSDTAAIVLGGAGDDTITAIDTDTAVGGTVTGATIKLYGEAGDDTITVDTDATNEADTVILDGGAGNDTITGEAADDTILGGTGNDIIDGGAGADVITTGAGSDIVTIVGAEDGDEIKDLTAGEDTLVLVGTSTNAALDLSDMTVASGAYLATSNHDFTLTNSTATDLTGLVQLGKQATATVAAVTFTTAVTADVTAGDFNDHITTGATAVTIDAGAGNDVIVASATNSDLTGGAGNDTFNLTAGTAVVNDLGTGDTLIVDTVTAATISVTSDFTATAATTSNDDNSVVSITLKDGANIDLTLATLAASTDGYSIATDNAGDDAVTQGATITASRGTDIVTASQYADTITGGENADFITAGKGGDIIDLTESVSAIDSIVYTAQTDGSAVGVAAGTFTGFDVVTGFTVGTDEILFDAANTSGAGAIDSVWIAALKDTVVAKDDATSAANDLAEGEYTDVDSVVAFINDSATFTNDTAATLEVLAITFDDMTAVYLVDSADATITAGEIELLGTFDAVLTATELVIV